MYDNNIKYSILIASLSTDENEIYGYLKNGIKVVLFVNEGNASNFIKKQEYKYFLSENFLNVYYNSANINIKIVDGIIESEEYVDLLKKLEKGDERFNLQQYLVEHENSETNILVGAGAGSGKTYTMINRIMYLIHCDPKFNFAKVAMITFTNDSTDDMRCKLISKIRSYYVLTGKKEYLRYIEEFSNITLSTLDSFFHHLLSEVGCERGYGKDISIKTYIYEKKEIIRDVINSYYDEIKIQPDYSFNKIEEVLGMSPHYLTNLAKEYWDKLDNYGVSELELEDMKWGDLKDEEEGNDSEGNIRINAVQKSLKSIFEKIGSMYSELKLKNNSVTIKDALNELIIILNGIENDESRFIEMKKLFASRYDYIFCDEFQDSDNMQIHIIYILCVLFDSRLFIVGDTKQSIYRFRGATDAAFEILREKTKERNIIMKEFPLSKNYRTCKPVMDEINRIFWKISGRCSDNGIEYFSYSGSEVLIPQNKYNGVFSIVDVKKEWSDSDRKKKFISVVRNIMNNPNCGRIVCLTRTNAELAKIKNWCEDEHILCLINQEGAFYNSPAVKDMCALTEAFMFNKEPMYLWNMINSSYCSRYADLNSFNPGDENKAEKLVYLKNIIGNEFFEKYSKLFRNKPVMSVIRCIITEINPVNVFKTKRKSELIRKGLTNEEAENQTYIDVRQYEADITKLLNILIDTFSGQFASLYDICDFLRLKISTDKKEELPRVKTDINCAFVEGMTVHSSKGLQFDNVIIPFMDKPFEKNNCNEIIISRKNGEINVGWKYYENKNTVLTNLNYENMTGIDKDEMVSEEIRLLYVAMTRAVTSLYCFKSNKKSNESIQCWQDLL